MPSWSFKSLALMGAVLAVSGFTSTTLDPDQAEIVTSDVDHFWQAFDDAAKAPADQRVAIYTKEYFGLGSQGFKDYVSLRPFTPEKFTEHVEQNRAYYTEIRPYIGQVVGQKPVIAAGFKRLKALYPDIKFPAHMYFIVGPQRALGINSPNGIIFAAEMLATPPGTPYVYNKASPVIVPFVAVHETIHFNQTFGTDTDDKSTLLQATINEGTADFIASLVVQEPDIRQMTDRWQYGCAHEAELAARFADEEDATKLQPWMYDHTPDTGWPPDMAYWLGYRIAQAYYDHATDKVSAIRGLLQVTDFKALLKASGYPEKKTACTPEKPMQTIAAKP
jgi:hypothetical protein